MRISGNECAYNVLPGSKILIFGETKDSENYGFFLSCLDSGGKVEWTKVHGKFEGVMASGIIDIVDGFIFSGSVKTEKDWQSRLFSVGMAGDIEWAVDVACERVFQMCSVEGGLILAGKRSGSIFLARADCSGKMLWQKEFGAGCGISVLLDGDDYVMGGENQHGNPFVCRIDKNGNMARRIDLEGSGWIGAVARHSAGIILARHALEPGEHTEILFSDI